MRMLFTLLLTALTATSGLAGSGSQEERASLTWTGGHTTGKVTVVIDGYTHNSTLTSGDSVPLGAQIILVCQVVGLPYGTPLSYTWTCSNGDCVPKVADGSDPYNYSRKIYNDSILAINTTYTSYGGTYTCWVTARGQNATGSFNINITGGIVVHSYGRLIPHEFPITDLQQISGPDGIGRITCTVSSGTARFYGPGGVLESDGVTQRRHGAPATLVVNPTDSFSNRDVYCSDSRTNYFYLFISVNDSQLKTPHLTINGVSNSTVEYKSQRQSDDDITNALIAGYEVTRFGVPMIGEFVNTGTGSRVTISPAVPGAQYRITAWALGNGTRSATPAVEDAITGEAKPSLPRSVTITRVFQDGVELNWLPPTEPNGEVHYVVEYQREDSGNWTSVNTTSDSTHYNLTGLHSGTNYTIRVVAVNLAGRATTTPPTLSDSVTPSLHSATPTFGTIKPTLHTFETISSIVMPTANIITSSFNTFTTSSSFVKSSSRIMESISSTINPTTSTVTPTSSTVEPTEETTDITDIDGTVYIAGAVAVGAFFLVTLLIASAITVVALRRRKRRKEVVPVEGTEGPEVIGISLTPTTSKQQENIEASGEREDLHHRSADALGQSSPSVMTAVRSVGDYYDIIDVPLQEGTGPQCKHTMDNQARGDPNAVYAVVDKSKKKKQEKTQGGASATTTQGADTEEQHYECSSVLWQDWVGNVVEPEVNHGGIEQGSPSNEAKETGPQTEPCDPSALYAVIDKSKKKKQEKTQGGASATTTQGADTEEQHYECSDIVGQDWFGTAVEVNPEATLTNAGCSSTDTETNDPQSEPYNIDPNALYAVVDKSKKRRKVSSNDAPSLTSADVGATESQKHNTGQGSHA